jgi:hypothetical protein
MFALGLVASVRADPKPLSKEEQAKIDKAVDRAVAFLKRSQKETGEFGDLSTQPPGLLFNQGYFFFPALALLESGVPATDPSIQKAVTMVRAWEPQMDRTYGVSLAILFLDRLGDPKDKEIIRSLALRLIAGQTYTGGWGYYCPTLSKQNENRLWKTLLDLHAKDNPPSEPRDGKTPKAPKIARANLVIPLILKDLAIFQDSSHLFKRREVRIHEEMPPPDLNPRFLVGTTDNSNTQFAVLALWAARRHGVPVDRTLALVVKRFMTSQNSDGTWNYRYEFTRRGRGKWDGLGMCNTMSALLGLAVAHGVSQSVREKVDSDIQERIITGLAVLSKEVGTPTGQMNRQVPIENMYTLWSVERVATLYNLSLIGEKDWYRWGAEILVTNQKDDGNWIDKAGFHSATARPSFGLLFLKRANFTRDLTAKLPLTGRELNKSIVACLRSTVGPTSSSSGSQGATSETNRDR